MLLTLTTTHRPATDFAFLLRKNPARAQTFDLPFGEARVFYPEAEEDRCTCALQVVVDPIGLVRKRGGPAGDGGALDQYMNDRPYAASSFLSVAIGRVFDSALAGRAKERPDLVDVPLPLCATISALPCGGDGGFLRQLFEPLSPRRTPRHAATAHAAQSSLRAHPCARWRQALLGRRRRSGKVRAPRRGLARRAS